MQDFYALLGRHDLANNNESGSVGKYISEIFIHPEWNSMNISYDADIAVLKVNSEITFSNIIQPICLPRSNAKIFNVRGTVVGYGISEESFDTNESKPKHIEIESVEHGVCLFREENLVKISSLRMFCGGEHLRTPCRGNSKKESFLEIFK